MPRILPRLIKELEKRQQPSSLEHWSFKPGKRPSQKKKSLAGHPRPPRPSYHPADYPDKSILLSGHADVILDSRKYALHKTLPPYIATPHPTINGLVQPRSQRSNPPNPGQDRPRPMTLQERRWWANPWLRMLGSPIRRCHYPERSLPSPFLVRMATFALDPFETYEKPRKTTLLPDGLQHSQFTVRKSGRATYFLCSKSAFNSLLEKGSWRRWANELHPHVIDQVSHLLRLRVLQELELLHEALLSLSRHGIKHQPLILRRLSKTEHDNISSGTLDWASLHPDAIAILSSLAPMSNTTPSTPSHIHEAMGASPPPHEIQAQISIITSTQHNSRLIPSSHLYTENNPDDQPFPNTLPPQKIPLYDCTQLFPNPIQRSHMVKLIHDILATNASFNSSQSQDSTLLSDSYLLISSPTSVVGKVDVAALGMALWRIWMFEEVDTHTADPKAWIQMHTK